MLLISSGTGSAPVAEPCGGQGERQRGAFGIGEVGRLPPLRPLAEGNGDLVNGNTTNALAGYTFFVSPHRSIEVARCPFSRPLCLNQLFRRNSLSAH